MAYTSLAYIYIHVYCVQYMYTDYVVIDGEVSIKVCATIYYWHATCTVY